MKRWPKVGERVVVRRTIAKTYVAHADETEDGEAVSELTETVHAEPITAVAVARVRLSTRSSEGKRVRHHVLGVRQTLRGPLLRAHLADVSPAGLAEIEPSERCGGCDGLTCTCPTLLDPCCEAPDHLCAGDECDPTCCGRHA